MTEFNPGDLVTFHLRDNLYGVAKILLIENLALNDNVHLSIHDKVLEATEPEVDIHGDVLERGHDFDGTIDTPPLITHLAVTYEAFLDSLPMKIGEAEVEERELAGYQMWLHHRYEHAVKQGMIREREEEEEADEPDELASEDEVESDEAGETEDLPEETVEKETGTTTAGETPQPKGAWAVMTLEDVPIGRWLFRQHDDIRDTELLAKSELGTYILSHYDDSNVGAIEELVRSFVEGDYGAGHELLDYGDTAANALERELSKTDSVDLADDILRILGDMGNDRAYEHIASYHRQHSDLAADPLALPAARGYCYAVMLTGGDPEPLRAQLGSIETMNHPELADDRKSALEAVAAAEKNRKE